MEPDRDVKELEEHASVLQIGSSIDEHTALPLSFVCRAADIYTRVFRATGDETVIDVALGLYRAALATFTQPDSPDRLSTVNGLAYALRTCFNRRRIPDDLEEAVLLSREAVSLSASSSSESKALWNLGASLRMAFNNLPGYSIDHLDEAITSLRQAVSDRSFVRQHHFHIATVDLAAALISRYRRTSYNDSLLEAISLLETVYGSTDVEKADRIYGAVFHVAALGLQANRCGVLSISVLDESLCIARNTLGLKGDWQYHLLLVQACANGLRSRCYVLGSICDADEALQLLQRAAHLDPRYLQHRPMFLRDLGIALDTRSHLTGSLRDQSEAIDHFRAYYNATTTDMHRATACWLLSAALLKRFEDLQVYHDLDEAISLARDAVRLVPCRHANSLDPRRFLASGLVLRHIWIHCNSEDLSEAISLYRQILAGSSSDSEFLIDFGDALRLQYEVSQDLTCLTEAMEFHTDAVTFAAPFNSHAIFHLLQDKLTCYKIYHDPTMHEQSMQLFRQLMIDQFSTAATRYYYAQQIGLYHGETLVGASKLEILRLALSLLPQVAYSGLHTNAPLLLSQAPEIAITASKHALDIGRVTEAVELIEAGRAIFWSKALNLRIPCDDIPGGLGQEFLQLSRTLEGLSRLHAHSGSHDISQEHLSRRHTMAEKYEKMLQDIRTIPGHEDFLLPHSFQKLCLATQGGIIAVLLPADVGYNAIIIVSTSETPQVVHLPNVTNERLVVLSNRFNREIQWLRARDAQQFDPLMNSEETLADRLQMTKRRERESTMETLLAELWRTAVHPVIEALHIPNHRGSPDRPRLFWCPTGQYVSIPLHAAGIYTTTNGPCAADYVIQSYIPTVSALLHAQRPHHPNADCGQNVLLVAQPSAPGYAPLPNTVHEINVVVDILGEAQLLGADDPRTATVQAVSSALSKASIVHLACHGRQDKEALQSGFVMNDGLLTVDEIMRLELPNAKFAFLSACHAAAINPDNPPDEVVHLAAAMLYSGFRSVIATMWSMNDADGPAVAREVYMEAFKDGQLDLSRVPYALDAAVQKLKDDGVPASRWATYIHMGA